MVDKKSFVELVENASGAAVSAGAIPAAAPGGRGGEKVVKRSLKPPKFETRAKSSNEK